MRPKLYFVMKTGLILAVAFLILLTSIFIAGLVLFSVRVNGHDSLLSFGPRGIELFLRTIPWTLVLLEVALIVLFEWLIRQFRFGYQRPALYLLLALIVSFGVFGTALDRGTSFNDDRFQEAEQGESFFPLGEIYEGLRQPAPEALGIYRGIVLSRDRDVLVMSHDDRDADGDDGTWTVILPAGFDGRLQKGDRVYVVGDKDGDSIRAYGVRLLDR
jgi:hypothetical protein